MANTDPILTQESSLGRGKWVLGSMQVDGALVLPTVDTDFTNPDLRTSGKFRYNTDTEYPEYTNGNGWQPMLAYISPNEFSGTDVQKIQSAIEKQQEIGLAIVIAGNTAEDNRLWLVDEAIQVYSNTNILIFDATIKLSDTCRDNMWRTANCGLGITDPETNPFENISIVGVGTVIFEGADNPRATAYNDRTLTVTSNTGSGISYGTDALVPSEKQTGDWRSTMMIFAYTTNILVENIHIRNAHGFAVGFERCHNYTTNFIDLYCPRERTYAATPQRVFNCDGIKVMQGGTYVNFLNTSGHTDDNMLTIGILGPGHAEAGDGAGVYTSNLATGQIYATGDDVHNVNFRNVKGWCYQSIVRCLNTLGSVVSNVNISNIIDTSIAADLTRTIGGGACIFGSFNATYGGPTPMGTCSDIIIDNVTMRNSRHGINIEGTLAEAIVSNFTKLNSTDRPAIYINPSSGGVRQLQVSNIYDNGSSLIHNGVYNGLSSFTGFKSDIIATDNSVQEIVLTGTSGTANVNIDGTDYLATFSSSLTTTATNFISTHAANILSAKAVTATSHTVVLKFVHATTAFPTITITNVTGDLAGTVGDVEVINTTSTVFYDPNNVGLKNPAGNNYVPDDETLTQKKDVVELISAETTKNKVLIADTVDGTDVTGTLSQTITKAYLIPANSTSEGVMTIDSLLHKTGTTGSVLYHIYTNTSNSLSGALLVGGSGTVSASNRTCVLSRKCYIKSGGTLVVFPTSTGASVPTVAGAIPTSVTFNPAVDNYIILTVTLSDITDSAKVTGCEIVFRKQ